ncbi:MAG: carbohydrate ABC transporter permease [Eubacteriales bacterium]|nr:carbohydrate ABC transporter permease [Eubacteriales bacterium]
MRKRYFIHETGTDRVLNVIFQIMCAFVLLVVVYPLWFVIIASFSDSDLVNTGKVLFYPKLFSTYGYGEIFKNAKIWSGYMNTIIYTVAGTTVNIIVTVTAAYSLSRHEFGGRRFVNALFVFTMFFNGGMVPTYMLISSLGLVNNRLVMILPFCVNVFNLIIVRSFFESTIPPSLYEASVLDGCSHFKYFFYVVVPLSKAVISVITLYYMVAHWNDFFNALLYINQAQLKPLQIILRDILLSNQVFSSGATGGTGMSYAQRYADQVKYGVIIVSTLPIMVIYPFIQKYFEKGVMIGAVKG